MNPVPPDIMETARDLTTKLVELVVGEVSDALIVDPYNLICQALLAERQTLTFTADNLRDLAHAYTMTDLSELIAAGVISGIDSRKSWERFNHNFDVFILKLDDENREALARFLTSKVRSFR